MKDAPVFQTINYHNNSQKSRNQNRFQIGKKVAFLLYLEYNLNLLLSSIQLQVTP